MGVIRGACLALIALFIPPVAPLLRTGCSIYFFIDILLTILGWIPGVLFAWYVILAYPSGTYGRRRSRNGHESHHHSSHGGHSHKSRYEDDYYPPAQGYYQQPPPPSYGRSSRHHHDRY